MIIIILFRTLVVWNELMQLFYVLIEITKKILGFDFLNVVNKIK